MVENVYQYKLCMLNDPFPACQSKAMDLPLLLLILLNRILQIERFKTPLKCSLLLKIGSTNIFYT